MGKPTLIGFVVGEGGVLIEIEIDFRRVGKEVHMSETYRTVVTNGKKTNQQNKPGTISNIEKKNLLLHTPTPGLEFVFVVHFFLAGMWRALVPRRVGESEARRGPGASRGSALVVDHQSPRERGESRASRCIILYKARLFSLRAPPAGQAYGASVKRPRVPTTPLSLLALVQSNLLFVAPEDDQGQSPPTLFPFVFLEMGRCSRLLHPDCPGLSSHWVFRMQLLMRSSLSFSLGSFHLYRVLPGEKPKRLKLKLQPNLKACRPED